MGDALTAFIFAAGVGGFAYSKLGARVGYGNGRSVWTLVAASFVATFLVVLILLKTLIHPN